MSNDGSILPERQFSPKQGIPIDSVEARARYDDDVQSVTKPVSPDLVRKLTVVEKAAPVAPVVVDRPPVVKEAIGNTPTAGGFVPSPKVPSEPKEKSGFTKAIVVTVGLLALLPGAVLLFIAVICSVSGSNNGHW